MWRAIPANTEHDEAAAKSKYDKQDAKRAKVNDSPLLEKEVSYNRAAMIAPRDEVRLISNTRCIC